MRIVAALCIIAALIVGGPALAQHHDHGTVGPQSYRQAQHIELGPGDKGYGHVPALHNIYQKIFQAGQCRCASGECRPTVAKSVRVDSKNPTGIQLKVNGHWCPVPPEAMTKIGNLKMLTEAEKDFLAQHPAHVCAYPTPAGGTCGQMECALANDPM